MILLLFVVLRSRANELEGEYCEGMLDDDKYIMIVFACSAPVRLSLSTLP